MLRIILFIFGAIIGAAIMPILLEFWAALVGSPVRCDGGEERTPLWTEWDEYS